MNQKVGGSSHVALLALALCGCSSVSGLNPRQIADVSDEKLCDPFAKGIVVENERRARGLGDCSPAHLQCKNMGYKPGTAEYLQCRQMITQDGMAAEAARQKIISGIAGAYKVAPPPPTVQTNTDCSQWGNDVHCSSTSQ